MKVFRKIIVMTYVLGLSSAVLASATGFAYLKQVSDALPSLDEVRNWTAKEGTVITASDGVVIGVHAKEFRKFAPLEAIPKHVVNAFIAAEDQNYWTHPGIDINSIARAGMKNMRRGGAVEGGSTITQQVIKNVVLDRKKTFDRKIREALLAVEADKVVGKQKILEIYLNEIYLGSGAYGVAAGARIYFGKDLSQLSLAEAAMLAVMPQAPSVVNPKKNLQKSLERRQYVLRRMLEDGYIKEAEYESANREEVVLSTKTSTEVNKPAYYFLYPEEAIRRALAQVAKDKLDSNENLKIETSLDARLQYVVHQELRAGLVREDRREGWQGAIARSIQFPIDWSSPDLQKPAGAEDWTVGVLKEIGSRFIFETEDGDVEVDSDRLGWIANSSTRNNRLKVGDAVLLGDIGNGMEVVSIPRVEGAVVVLNPENGAIRALDGGFSAELSQFNRATQAKRQTGSTFKPLVYLSALNLGYDATSPILDTPITLEQGPGQEDWKPKSHDGSMGLITLRRSLELSRNESTVRLAYDIGLPVIEETAKKAGFPLSRPMSFSMALGTGEATPLDMAEVYANFANGGYHIHPTFTPKYQKQEKVRTFDPIAVAQLSSILEGVTYAGTAQAAFAGFDKPIAAKTGTTDDSKDTWFSVYGPKFVMVVWVGKDDNTPLKKGAAGGVTAAGIARNIFDKSEGMFDYEPFMLPDGASTIMVDRETGLEDEAGDVVEIVRDNNGN